MAVRCNQYSFLRMHFMQTLHCLNTLLNVWLPFGYRQRSAALLEVAKQLPKTKCAGDIISFPPNFSR